MVTKLKTNEVNSEDVKNKIGKGFIISILAIIITSIGLNLFLNNVLNKREIDYFRSGSFINDISGFKDVSYWYRNHYKDMSIIDEYNFSKLLIDKENAPKIIDENMNNDLAQNDNEYNGQLKSAEEEKKGELEEIRQYYHLEKDVNLEELKSKYSKELENWGGGDENAYNTKLDIVNNIDLVLVKYNNRVEELKNSKKQRENEIKNDANELKGKIKYSTMSSIRPYENSDIGFDYKLESDDGKIVLYNNKEIENLKDGTVYFEVHFGKNIDDFKVLKTVENNTVSAAVYDKLIYRIKSEIGEDIKNTTLKFAITKRNAQPGSYLEYRKVMYSLSENLDYMLIILGVLFVLFMGAVIVPYKGQSLITRAYCKLWLEFKIAFFILLFFGVYMLVTNIGAQRGIFLPIFMIASIMTILTGRYIRYIFQKGFINGFLRNLCTISILIGFKNFVLRFFGRERKKEKKVKKVSEERVEEKTINLVKSTSQFKDLILNNIDNRNIPKKIIIYTVAISIYLIIGLLFGVVSISQYSMGLLFLGSTMVLSVPIIFWFLSRKFFVQLAEIEEASKSIVKGDFNVDLKERNSKELNVISENLSNINTGFKAAIQGELKSERMKAELITNVSHDLKTPLTSIINYVDLLQKENITEEQKEEYLAILENKSKRLKVLIEDLFEATKASSGNISLNIEEVDVVAILRQTIGEFKEKIESSGLEFKINVPKEKIILKLDGARTWRIFDNLIGNALKYSMKNSRVYIDLKKVGDKVIFEIKNISAYELNCDPNELRERFKRGDSSRHTEGSGLGLSIANSLVELQGGKLSVDIDGDLFKVKIIF